MGKRYLSRDALAQGRPGTPSDCVSSATCSPRGPAHVETHTLSQRRERVGPVTPSLPPPRRRCSCGGVASGGDTVVLCGVSLTLRAPPESPRVTRACPVAESKRHSHSRSPTLQTGQGEGSRPRGPGQGASRRLRRPCEPSPADLSAETEENTKGERLHPRGAFSHQASGTPAAQPGPARLQTRTELACPLVATCGNSRRHT